MNTDKITVIYHSADFDGLFCREIARKFLPTAELIGWDYGNPKLSFPSEGAVYVLDLSPECFESVPQPWRLIWIDHHRTAIEKYDTEELDLGKIAGYRIDGVAACRLAWQWFTCNLEHKQLPPIREYLNRAVTEPRAVQLAGEYDIWDKRNPNVDVFQLGLRSRELTPEDWKWLLTCHEDARGELELGMLNITIDRLLQNGRLLQDYVNRRDAAIVAGAGFLVDFAGLKFLALNSATKGSLQFAAKDVPATGHDALLKFNFDGQQWDVSLYHAAHRTELDLSPIAQQHGGGGHRAACGFRAQTLPFLN